MAIIFVSPTKKRLVTVWIISAVLLVVLALAAALIFLPELKKGLNVAEPESILTIPEVKVNFAAIDSDRVKELDSFSSMSLEFAYSAKDANLKDVTGTVVAISEAEATAKLQAMNLTVVTIQLAAVGRTDPFAAYYAGTNTRR